MTNTKAERVSSSDVVEGSLRQALVGRLRELISVTNGDDPLDLVVQIRQLRLDLDAFEIEAGKIARRDHDLSVRRLAAATGIAERNASKRWPNEREKGD